MKKTAKCLAVISAVVFVITWGVMGLKLLENNYRITTEAYVGLVALVVFFICMLYAKFMDRCPHCGKTKQFLGKYCTFCGKEIN